ncbi:MAG: UDP-N-acetylglucosamine--N-acetylmuramyl-(pentapeptide) pyrophosphoryl-undecaprenol N-acetylglucosamine transferase [Candidatus Yonathbacteria bacterium]|nr:UDP-N-acetylglucosamine--N-acetylmuramyl-(pentapeptide) pyrophosphoryl-undecaprenol N-acetylglucosamine transferase [Candidatus Yonathbacteria bacterium]NTW47878.1 UDP-N-acetylglucosamine--N-acetylmuramyl-(pentapeptide) pyrophosphoryl-undecaprenol N-acetylglucosamine transferase [Candidatus Yonathbacteria bacterium]
MKILFTGSGTGGHFYPLIAVAEEINRIAEEEHLVSPKLYFMGPTPYDNAALAENGITFTKVSAGKVRRYASLLNITDMIKTAQGVLKAIWAVFLLFPDVVFSKGGYTSVPVVFASRFFGIPVVVHESDSKPGRANAWAAKFAKRIAISYPSAATYFPAEKTALTGNPVRKAIREPQRTGAREYLKLEEKTPVIFVMGGSQGAKRINETVLDSLTELVKDYEIIHQTGVAHIDDIEKTSHVILKDNPHAHRYHPFAYLNDLAMKMSAGAADIIVSRAGSTIFEIAQWGLPSIILPLSQDVSHDQFHNAITYAKSGACLVIEDHNLSPHVLIADIRRILENETERNAMKEAALSFTKNDAATVIAKELLAIALKHEGGSEEGTMQKETEESTAQPLTAGESGEAVQTNVSHEDSPILGQHSGMSKKDETERPFSIGPH